MKRAVTQLETFANAKMELQDEKRRLLAEMQERLLASSACASPSPLPQIVLPFSPLLLSLFFVVRLLRVSRFPVFG